MQPKVIIFFGLHSHKIILNVYKIKNKRLYQELLTKNIKISSGVEGITCIEIQKRIDLIQVIIYMRFPKFLIEGKGSPGRIEELLIIILESEFFYRVVQFIK